MIKLEDIRASNILDYELYPLSEETTLEITGENRRGLLVVIADEEKPEMKSFLEKILQAVHFSMDEDALTIWGLASGQFGFSDFARRHQVSQALFFGLNPSKAGLNLDISFYKPVIVGQKAFLFCHNLSEIQANQTHKRQLWEALQSIFLKK